jgi:argininosuccinate lyase
MLFPAFQNLKDCLRMMNLMLSNIQVKEGILVDDKYKFIFSVEEVNRLVLSGIPFRDAYKQVGLDIQLGSYNPERNVSHSHEGSIGNLCNDEIKGMMDKIIGRFEFEKAIKAINNLLDNK